MWYGVHVGGGRRVGGNMGKYVFLSLTHYFTKQKWRGVQNSQKSSKYSCSSKLLAVTLNCCILPREERALLTVLFWFSEKKEKMEFYGGNGNFLLLLCFAGGKNFPFILQLNMREWVGVIWRDVDYEDGHCSMFNAAFALNYNFAGFSFSLLQVYNDEKLLWCVFYASLLFWREETKNDIERMS